ncbi:cadherin-like beta sandwich domain-containing protein, partial [Escherichia coli]|nr:cadherin-like beta sandwich domain-containing protein [Escherichia coli]
TDAALSALTASYGEISPAFTSDVTDYVLYVPHETEHITLSGTARDGKAVQVTGADAALDEGENVLTVTCTAEDGVTVMTYTVHVW